MLLTQYISKDKNNPPQMIVEGIKQNIKSIYLNAFKILLFNLFHYQYH